MKGSIRQRSKGSWEICIDVGPDPATGRRQRHFESVKGNKANAQRRLAQLLVNIEEGSYIKPKRITLGEWLGNWLNGYVRTNCSLRTLDGYQSIVRHHLIPSLGTIPLAQLQPQHIQQYYARALSGAGDRKELSARTVLHFHRVIFQALKYAVRQGLLIRNPAQLVDPPRARKPKMRTLMPEEVARLLSVAEDIPYYPIIYTAVKTGLRQAELLGLRWRDLDLDLASLSVTQVLYKRRGICQFKEPKTAHSRRRLNLLPSLALFLREYRAERQAECLFLRKPLSEDDLVFSNINGNPMDPGTLTHKFARIAQKAGLAGIRFHDLRHTFASLMLLAGIHPKIVSEALGHSSVAFTLDVYSHVIPGLQEAAAKRLDKVFELGLTEMKNVGKMSANRMV
ncbi:Tyrosine recombinase XerC [subsurface metagenome]|jgi:integrase